MDEGMSMTPEQRAQLQDILSVHKDDLANDRATWKSRLMTSVPALLTEIDAQQATILMMTGQLEFHRKPLAEVLGPTIVVIENALSGCDEMDWKHFETVGNGRAAFELSIGDAKALKSTLTRLRNLTQK
jgi:hypothetical protein